MHMPRFFKSRLLVGIGGLALTIAPYFQESDTMNIYTWSLVVIGSALVLWGVIKPEHQLSPKEAVELLRNRRTYLPRLKKNIEKQIRQLEYIRGIASKFTFTQYLGKYYSSQNSFKWAVKIAPIGMYNNLYYQDLKNTNDAINVLEAEYDILVSQVTDPKLKKKLKQYWEVENMNNSRIVFSNMMKNDKYEIKPIVRMLSNIIDGISRRNVKVPSIRDVMVRIDELLRGALDE